MWQHNSRTPTHTLIYLSISTSPSSPTLLLPLHLHLSLHCSFSLYLSISVESVGCLFRSAPHLSTASPPLISRVCLGAALRNTVVHHSGLAECVGQCVCVSVCVHCKLSLSQGSSSLCWVCWLTCYTAHTHWGRERVCVCVSCCKGCISSSQQNPYCQFFWVNLKGNIHAPTHSPAHTPMHTLWPAERKRWRLPNEYAFDGQTGLSRLWKG